MFSSFFIQNYLFFYLYNVFIYWYVCVFNGIQSILFMLFVFILIHFCSFVIGLIWWGFCFLMVDFIPFNSFNSFQLWSYYFIFFIHLISRFCKFYFCFSHCSHRFSFLFRFVYLFHSYVCTFNVHFTLDFCFFIFNLVHFIFVFIGLCFLYIHPFISSILEQSIFIYSLFKNVKLFYFNFKIKKKIKTKSKK